jgi:hypothetical protein
MNMISPTACYQYDLSRQIGDIFVWDETHSTEIVQWIHIRNDEARHIAEQNGA